MVLHSATRLATRAFFAVKQGHVNHAHVKARNAGMTDAITPVAHVQRDLRAWSRSKDA
jgi:hypothetical protein